MNFNFKTLFSGKEGAPALLLSDYPRGVYSAYWETFYASSPGGFSAEVRLYSYDTAQLLETYRTARPERVLLAADVKRWITAKMLEHKRG